MANLIFSYYPFFSLCSSPTGSFAVHLKAQAHSKGSLWTVSPSTWNALPFPYLLQEFTEVSFFSVKPLTF